LKALTAGILLVLSSQTFALSGRVYGLINTATHFTDIGELSADAVRTNADMDGEGYGIGADYAFKLPSESLSLRLGFLYEFERDIKQIAQVTNGAAAAERENLPSIQMSSIYASMFFKVAQNISLVGGLAFYAPKVEANRTGDFGDYDIKSGAGYHYGIDFRLPENFFVQLLHRRIVLDTKDTDYKGEIDLSNLALMIGKEF
jgi:hypothetical protein